MSPRGLGALVTTDVEYAELGQYGDRHVRGRVERRSLRIGAGEGGRFRIVLGRVRPVAVEVSEPDGTYVVPIEAPRDPMRSLATAVLVMLVASWTVARVLARFRHTRQ